MSGTHPVECKNQFSDLNIIWKNIQFLTKKKLNKIYLKQCAKKVVSDSPGLVDFCS